MSPLHHTAREQRLIDLAGPDRYFQAVRLAEKAVKLPSPAAWLALYMRLAISELLVWSLILAGGVAVAVLAPEHQFPYLLGAAIAAALTMTIYRLIRLVELQDCARDLVRIGKLCEHLEPRYRQPLDAAIQHYLTQMNVPVANSNDPVTAACLRRAEDRQRRQG